MMGQEKSIDEWVDECIEAYRTFVNDTLALDYVAVTGKYRALVLENERYKTRTRQIKAQKYKEEIEYVEKISKELDALEDDDDDEFDSTEYSISQDEMYDPRLTPAKRKQLAEQRAKEAKRNGGGKSRTGHKDFVTMRFQTNKARRELLRLNTEDNAAEEVDALNFFFVALSAPEFEALPTTEVFHNRETQDDAFAGDAKEAPRHVETREEQLNKQFTSEDSFVVLPDGSMEDI